MGQGEGNADNEERIFLGNTIRPDTAPSVISHQLVNNKHGMLTVKARIHDNESPSMPQDWSTVEVIVRNSKAMPMSWYGENLWVATLPETSKKGDVEICATDYCGNKACLTVKINP